MRVEQTEHCTLYLGDCLGVLPTLGKVDAVVTDPPYGETSLEWDKTVEWLPRAVDVLLDSGSIWVFGTLRHLMSLEFRSCGLAMSQDVIWEKHNGTNCFTDRFRRVHEQAAQFYKVGKWNSVFKKPLFTNDATAKTVRRKNRPPQWGDIGGSSYESFDGGPKMMRSVMFCRSCHGYAEHPTQKPVDVIVPLIEYSTDTRGTILDPFMGSGTTGVASVRTDRKFIGVEKELKYFDVAIRRIEEAENERKTELASACTGVPQC